MTISFKGRIRLAIWSCNSITGNMAKRNKHMLSKRYLHQHAYNSTVHNSQNLESTKAYTDGLMDKENNC